MGSHSKLDFNNTKQNMMDKKSERGVYKMYFYDTIQFSEKRGGMAPLAPYNFVIANNSVHSHGGQGNVVTIKQLSSAI